MDSSFIELKPVTRAGYAIVGLSDTYLKSEGYLYGIVVLPLPNGRVFHRFMEWDIEGNSISKEKYPTDYYYDIVFR